ncbi:MAG: response regulator transcription factor [Burkholderiales bacterium]|jgi:DNA-binding NarL/FixJ family response regulator|nr:response regulator transcription factor [Burkholderiales bacterium]
MRILVVDDHPLMAEAIGVALRLLDGSATLATAADLATALELSGGEDSFDLALLDLGLPDCSGLDGLARFRAARPALPVVVVSGASDAATIVAALDLGAMGFIPKTSSRDILLSAVRLVAAGQVYVPIEALHAQPVAAVAEASAAPRPASATGTVRPADLGLTPRQADVLALLLKGHSNKLIARKLDITESTVKVHVSAVLQSLNVTTRTQALIAAMSMGLRLDA